MRDRLHEHQRDALPLVKDLGLIADEGEDEEIGLSDADHLGMPHVERLPARQLDAESSERLGLDVIENRGRIHHGRALPRFRRVNRLS